MHEFSLRSLPWPEDPIAIPSAPAGTFNFSFASITTVSTSNRGDKEIKTDVADWAEAVTPTLQLDHGIMDFIDPDGEHQTATIAGWPNTTVPILQLCHMDLNPPKLIEEESIIDQDLGRDYFSQNVYFKDESNSGRLSVETPYESEKSDTTYSDLGSQNKKWTCEMCNLSSTYGSHGENAYFRHLDTVHLEDMKAEQAEGIDMEVLRRIKLNDAYWNGV